MQDGWQPIGEGRDCSRRTDEEKAIEEDQAWNGLMTSKNGIKFIPRRIAELLGV